MEDKIIKFLKTTDPFGFLSNFYKCNILIDNKIWTTSEHYFQAMKFNDISIQDTIRKIDSPKNAKNASKYFQKFSSHYIGDSIWSTKRLEVMRFVILEKFKQNSNLRQWLINTDPYIIQEDSPKDNFWGIGKNGDGANMLGIILMETRDKLKENIVDNKFF